jgi:hypothetical protein
LLTDAVSQSFLVSAQLGGFLAMMAENGSPFQFGTDDPGELMAGHGCLGAVLLRRMIRGGHPPPQGDRGRLNAAAATDHQR